MNKYLSPSYRALVMYAFVLWAVPLSVSAAGSWTAVGTTGFSGGAASSTSLVIDSSDNLYVAYEDGANSNKATVMKYNGSEWAPLGDAGFSAGTASSTVLRIDSNDTLYVAFADGEHDDKATVMKYSDGSWSTVGSAGFSAGAANYIWLAFDSSDNPYVVYEDGGNSNKATVMKYADGAWSVVGSAGFSAGTAGYTYIAFDDDTPYVGYADGSVSNAGTVMKYADGSWSPLGSAGFNGHAVSYLTIVANDGGVRAIYADSNISNKLNTMNYGTRWTATGRISSAGAAQFVSSALSSSAIYVAYKDVGTSNKASVMQLDVVTAIGGAGFSAGTAQYTSIALDSSSGPYVAYQDGANSNKVTVMKYVVAPTVTTQSATSLGATSVTGNGNITATGSPAPTVRGFVYGETTAYGATTTESGSFSSGAFTGSITGLTCNTTYNYRAYATNDAGTSYGSNSAFTTGECPTPDVSTSVVTSIEATAVTGNGLILSVGSSNVTVRGFVYGTTIAYGATTTESGDFSGIESFSASISGLTCNTAYHYRAYATNSSGTTYGSDETFTTSACPDADAPVISDIASSTTSTGASITWTTDENASTKVVYSVDSAYASSTAERDTESGVTSHSATLSDLLSCTLYNFKTVSADTTGNYATSSVGTFLTAGCPGGATPSSRTSSAVTVNAAATSTITDRGRTFTVATPADFTATSSSIVIQIKGLPSDTALGSIGKPSSSLSSAAQIVFDVTALIDNTTVLDSFDAPVTISYAYTDADVSGLDESTLAMYHYHADEWLPLDDCTVDTDANTITCDAPSFSTFAIFGSALASSSSSAGGSAGGGAMPWCSGPLAPGWNASLPNGGCGTTAPAPSVAVASFCPAYRFTRTLRFGMTGEDVRALQRFLNCAGYSLGASGPGSAGNETTVFAQRTLASVNAFQSAYASQVLAPLELDAPTGIFARNSQTQAYALMQAQ